MSLKRWRGVSAAEASELWRRWREGQPLWHIARVLGRPDTTLQSILSRHGGFVPPTRRRSARHLSLSEREEISRGICSAVPLRQIARRLSRSPSTIAREIARHGGAHAYRAAQADQAAWQRACRPKRCVLIQRPELSRRVAQKLRLNWSPQQISGWLERAFANDDTMRVSHETIYRSLFIQARGVLKQQLLKHLRSQRSKRYPKRSVAQPGRAGAIQDALSIRQRPVEAQDRALPGHWEGDLLCGGRHTQIATLVERHSRFVMLVKIPSKDTATVVAALSRHARQLPRQLRRSLTWDRGLELADHKRFTLATDMQVYFCDPQSPWQRGSNENTNGLLRQYFPKGKDLASFSQTYLNKVALQMNQRPRKTLGWQTPEEKFLDSVALTG